MSWSPWVRASPSAHEGSHNLCLLTQKVVLITLKEFLACFAKANLKMFNQWITDNQTYWKGLPMGQLVTYTIRVTWARKYTTLKCSWFWKLWHVSCLRSLGFLCSQWSWSLSKLHNFCLLVCFLFWVNLARWSRVKVWVINQDLSFIAPQLVTQKNEWDFPNTGSNKIMLRALFYLFVLTYKIFKEKNYNWKSRMMVVSRHKAILICHMIWGETIAQGVCKHTKEMLP